MQEMVLAGILSFSDKIIDKELANEIRRSLSMTKVGAINVSTSFPENRSVQGYIIGSDPAASQKL